MAMSTLVEILIFIWLKLPLMCISEVIKFCVPVKRKSIAGEIILVTGAGHGLGRSLSVKLAGMGGRMVLWDMNKAGCDETRDIIKSRGGVAFSYLCDVTDVEAVTETGKLVRKDVGDVTVLVNNAGIFNCRPLLDLSVDDVRRCVDVNLISHFWMLKEFLPHMLKWNHGHVVGISSVAGLSGAVNASDYSATKFGVRGLMWSLEDEINSLHQKHGVKVTVVCPSFIDTGLAHNPVVRFPAITPIFTADEAADVIADGICRDLSYVYIPKWSGVVGHIIIGILPYKASLLFTKFLGIGAGSHGR